jgi:hypothetical protein
MGLFSKLFGSKAEPGSESPSELAAVAAPAAPDAILVLRRGMNVPADDYVAAVVTTHLGAPPPEGLFKTGLSQPSWFKNSEIAHSAAADAARAYALKFSLGEVEHEYRLATGPDGAEIMIVELRRIA